MMGLIVSEIYDALVDAGASPDRAKAAAGAVPSAENMVTKEDIGRIETRIVKIETDIIKIRADMATKQDLAKLDKQIAVLRIAVFGFGPAIMALLVKLTFFP